MPRVVHFEIHADDLRRAMRFYADVFDWQFTRWDGPDDYWLVLTGPDGQAGINGGLVQRRGAIDGTAMIAFVCTIDVPDADEYSGRVERAGGRIVHSKQSIPGVGWLTYAKDSEGNVFGMMHADPHAR